MRVKSGIFSAVVLAALCPVSVADEPRPAQTQPARRMLWDRARVAVDLARREAQARKAVEELERRAKGNPAAADAQLLAKARAELERIIKENQEARRAMAGGVVFEKAAYLGIASTPTTPVLRKHLKLPDGVGLVVDFVEPESPAAQAGIQAHDVAYRLNEQILVNPQQLAVLVRTFEPDTAIMLKLFRKGESIDVPVKLTEREVKPLSEVGFGVIANVAPPTVQGFEFRVDPADPFAEVKVDPPLQIGDLVRVTVHDLGGPGAQTVLLTYVERDGRISLPQLKTRVAVEGKAGRELVDVIREAYREAGLFEHPHISVQLMKPAQKAKGEKK